MLCLMSLGLWSVVVVCDGSDTLYHYSDVITLV